MPSTEPEVGESVSLRLLKWDGAEHRQLIMAYLGSDRYGRWLGYTSKIESGKLGAASASGLAWHVMLIPHTGCFLAHFNAPPARNAIYADITTAPGFGHDGSEWVIAAADMDLDVVRTLDGQVWIEDQDEFAEHTITYGYPAGLVADTRAVADELLASVREELEPFGLTWRRWMGQAMVIITES